MRLAWPASLRARLTLWFTMALGVPLFAFGVASYEVFARTLLDRTDHFVADALTAFSRELTAERRMTASTESAAIKTVEEVRFRDLQIAILDTSGLLLALGEGAEELGPDRRLALDVNAVLRALRTAPRDSARLTLPDAAGGYRVLARRFVLDGTPLQLVAAYPLHDVQVVLERIRRLFLLVVPLLLVVAAAGAWFIARRGLSPVAGMAARASVISASTLHERLPVPTPDDELGGLATVINGLLDRLERAFAQQRRFMADASHELRTPTAIVRTEADVTLSRPTRTEAEYRESVTVIQDASRRLTRIVDDLFLLARADTGHLVVREEDVYLEDIVLGAVRGIQHIAEQRGVHVDVDAMIEAPLHGDPEVLGRLVLNLVDNAVKYSADGATVRVALTARADEYVIAVQDDGPGIPADAQVRIFERFYRVDAARSRVQASATSGAGLGLSIARHAAEAHGGRLELAESRPGCTRFVAVLPARRASVP